MSKRVLIVGGGVIGLCTAYYCARRGFGVTVVERKAAAREGCSSGNAGMVVPSHFIPLAAPGMVALGLKWMWNPASPLYIKPRLDADLLRWGFQFWCAATPKRVQRAAPLLRDLHLASRACFEELAALPDLDFGLVKKGLLMLCRERLTLNEEAKLAEQARALGVPAEVLDARQAATLNPGVRMDVAGAVHFPLDCHLSPDRFLGALQVLLQRLGVQFLWQTDVSAARLESRQRLRALVTATGSVVEADEFVLTGGAWAPQLASSLGLCIPIQAGKGYSLTLTRPRQLPELCSICAEARVAVTPMNGALRVGGTIEFAGLKEDINPVRVRGVIDSFCRYFPDFRPEDFSGISPWCGLRPCSPDGLPFIGRTARFTNLALATGHGMMGLSLGPVTGKLVADLLVGDPPAWDLRLLSADRYG